MSITGKCLCGAVSYAATADTLPRFDGQPPPAA